MVPLAAIPQHYAATAPAAACFRQDGETLDWAGLEARASRWARLLAAHGVGPDALVAMSMANGAEFLAASFGIWKAGATPAPLSPKLTAAERREILEIMRPAAFVTDDASLGGLVPAMLGDVGETGAGAMPALHVATGWKACTSGGSTGRPKVIVDHRPAAFDLDFPFLDMPRDQVVLNPGPLYHNGPFSALAAALIKGNRVIGQKRFDAAGALDLIASEQAVWAMLVPTMMHRIWRLPDEQKDPARLASLRLVVHTAAPIAPWLKQAWIDWLGGARVGEVYGATEGIVRTWVLGTDWASRPGTVGQAIGGTRLSVRDPAGAPVAPGVVGEVFAMPPNGPGSTYHYIGAEPRRSHDGWESVGDLGWLDEDGFLFLADRRVDLIITGGVNVFPAEVEAALSEHADVLSCAVVGVADDDLGQRVHAVVQATPGSDLGADALLAFARTRLSGQKVPRSVEFRDGPVRDDAGKVRRATLLASPPLP